MSDAADALPTPAATLPKVWRIASWQPAALILFATVLLALDIYGDLALGWLTFTAALAIAALAAALAALRYALVADEDGIWIRTIFGQQVVEWPQVSDIEVTGAHLNTVTVRISRVDDTFVDVPPTLVQPTLPTKIAKSRAMVGDVARDLLAMRAARR